MGLTRRQLVVAGAASWLCAGVPRALADGTLKLKGGSKGPRYFVTFFLRGGMDAVYTVDPKQKAEVAPKVDVPYEQSGIVDAGNFGFGPHFKSMAKWAPKMAIVRGVQVHTANHETGAFQMLRMRTDVTTSMPSLYDIIGQSRDTQPLASVTLGDLSSFEHSPGAVIAPTGATRSGQSSLDAIDEMSDDDVAALALAYKTHLARFPKWLQSDTELRTKEHVSQAAAFFEKMKTTKRFDPKAHRGRVGQDLMRALWLIENDLTRGVAVKIVLDWDSHYRNADKQAYSTGEFLTHLDKFLDALHSAKNEHGSLAEQTLVIIGSELGRFPIINGNLGKDHFPEAPYIFMGPSVNVGQAFVPTGKMMEGMPVSHKTGKAGEPGAEHLVLDDIGTTLVHMAGLNPTVFGYQGKRLEFLERT